MIISVVIALTEVTSSKFIIVSPDLEVFSGDITSPIDLPLFYLWMLLVALLFLFEITIFPLILSLYILESLFDLVIPKQPN